MMHSKQMPLHTQHGAALVVGLVLLLVMTLLAVTNMSMTTLELRMAANTQNKNHAFQAASAAIDGVVANGYTDMQTTPGQTRTITGYGVVNPNLSVNMQRSAMYEGRCIGGKSAVYDLRTFRCVHYQIDVTGTHVPSSARSLQTQGVFVVGAKPQG